jgi:hypothetical protein
LRTTLGIEKTVFLVVATLGSQVLASDPASIRFNDLKLDRVICEYPIATKLEVAELDFFKLFRDPKDCKQRNFGKYCKTKILDPISGDCREYGYTKGHILIDDNFPSTEPSPKGWSTSATGSWPKLLPDTEQGSTLYERPQSYLRVPDNVHQKEEVSFK